MKSIKPGRGPSLLGGIVGVVMVCFGVIWTILTGDFPLFAVAGILWTAAAAAFTVFSFRNAVGKNRFSSYDVTDAEEEPDPLNRRFGKPEQARSAEKRYCPYCGAEVRDDFAFCGKCGRKLPE